MGGVGAAIGGSSAAGGLGAIGGAIGTKAAAGVVTAALLTAGAVEVKETTSSPPVTPASKTASIGRSAEPVPRIGKGVAAPAASTPVNGVEPVENTPLAAPAEPKAEAPTQDPAPAPPAAPGNEEEAAGQSKAEEEVTIGDAESGAIGDAKPSEEVPGAHGGSGVVVVTTAPPPPPAAEATPEQELESTGTRRSAARH
jgi:hypothetical protein